MPYLTATLCCLYSATLLIYYGAYAQVALIMAGVGLLLLPFTRKNLSTTNKKAYLAIVGYFALTVISLLINGGGINQADMPSRTLLVLPVIALLVTYRPCTKWVMIGLPIGGIIVFGVTAYQHFVLHSRPLSSNGYMAIQASGMAMTLGILSLLASYYFHSKKQNKLVILACAGAVGGITASLWSGSRGVLVISPLVLLAIVWIFRAKLTKKTILASLVVIMIGSATVYPLLSVRINNMVEELNNYRSYSATEQHNLSGGFSANARLELWKSALYMAKDYPIFGAGFDNIDRIRAQQIKQGLLDPRTARYTRAHNQFFEDLQTKGLLGVTVLLIMFGVPLSVFIKRYKAYKETEYGYFALMGASHIILLMGYCLTQHYLAHHSGMLLFITYTAMFLALSEPPKQSDTTSALELSS